ncbi:MAG: flagellar type III secretion system protein FlhB [Pseudomonadota bacterium]
MAEEEDAEKPFDPSPSKYQKAREEGDIARSLDLVTAFSYTSFLIALAVFSGNLTASFHRLFTDSMGGLVPASASAGNAFGVAGTALIAFLPALAAIFAAPFAGALIGVSLQNALLFTPKRIKPKLSKISPLSNVKNKFGRNGLFEFFKSFVKLLIFGSVFAAFFAFGFERFIGLFHFDFRGSYAEIGWISFRFCLYCTAVMSAIGIIDYLWQVVELKRRNMMSYREVKEEHKSQEGDAYLKRERRIRSQNILSGALVREVPTADVVVVNPTHFAVALRWDRMSGRAPVCVAKGVDEVALRIREIASENGVPIHRDPPTARALYATLEPGDEINSDLYRPVAAAIRFAEKMRTRHHAKNQ